MAFLMEQSSEVEGLERLQEQMVAWRRHLHQHPELSFHESETAQFVAQRLEELGVMTQRGFAGHAVIGRIVGAQPGPTVALRADMDALPIQDGKEDCAYRSRVQGVMHACGHDAHTAMLLGLAQWFAARREQLKGTVLLVFQHAEEQCPGGAVDVLASGAIEEADVVYGVHLWSQSPVGHVYCAPGPLMAAADTFSIVIQGKGGHAGMPHEAVDSIVVGAHTVVALQSIVSRFTSPELPSVLTVGSMQAGSAFNVIAGECRMKGTVRTFDETTRLRIRAMMNDIARQTAAMFGAQAVVDYESGYPAVVNDEREALRFFDAAARVFPESHVHRSSMIMAAEDFAYYLQQKPGCYMFVGAGNADKGIVYPHHHPKFDVDEDAMLHGARLLAAMALHYMNERA